MVYSFYRVNLHIMPCSIVEIHRLPIIAQEDFIIICQSQNLSKVAKQGIFILKICYSDLAKRGTLADCQTEGQMPFFSCLASSVIVCLIREYKQSVLFNNLATNRVLCLIIEMTHRVHYVNNWEYTQSILCVLFLNNVHIMFNNWDSTQNILYLTTETTSCCFVINWD